MGTTGDTDKSGDYTVNLSTDGLFVEINPRGPLTPRSVIQSQKDANRIARESGVNLFLVDLRGIPGSLSPVDDVLISEEMFNDPAFPFPARIAIVKDREDTRHGFFETAARNKGINVKFFTSHKDAIAWLMI